uniref:CTLH domain-containing protein n=1 Tax=Daucus carota subsp. sativus TaxID=79200 RepID=A0A162B1G5_DAUCS
MKLDVSILDDLVHEYCVYRGIVDSGSASAQVVHIVSGPLKASSIEADADMISSQTIDNEERYPYETTSNQEDCSTSGTNQMSKVLQRDRGQGIAKRNKRKHWRGRQEDFEITPEVINASSKQDVSTIMAPTSPYMPNLQQEKLFILDSESNMENRYEILLRMKELASRGMAAEVVEEINVMDPNFFTQNPLLLFQLKQLEFLKLVRAGDHSSALKIASATLGPLGAKDPTLLKQLKKTLMALLRPNEVISTDDSALNVIGHMTLSNTPETATDISLKDLSIILDDVVSKICSSLIDDGNLTTNPHPFCPLRVDVEDFKRIMLLMKSLRYQDLRQYKKKDIEASTSNPQYLEFAGRMVALALMHKVAIGVRLDQVLAERCVSLEDIRDADPTSYRN